MSVASVPSFSLRRRAVLMLLLANLFWGLSFPLIKAIELTLRQTVPTGGTWFVTAGAVAPRFLLGSVLLLLFYRRLLGSFTRLEVEQGVLLALAAGGGMLFQNDGLQFTSASVSAFLTQFYAIMIPLWIAVRRRRWPPAVVVAGAVLVVAGVAVLGRFDFRHLRLGRGEIETLLSSVFFMAQIFLLERKGYAANRPLPITLVMFVVDAALFSLLAAGAAPHWSDLLAPWRSPAWVGFSVVLAVLCTVVSYLLMNFWQPRITATEAGLIYCVEPVFASLLALFLPALFSAWAGLDYANEQLTWHLLAGGGLITLANILIQLRPPPPA